jgi:uncharacterized protein YjbJ (UPF0337 family)
MSKIGSKIKNVAGAIQEAAGKTIGDPVIAAKGHLKKDEGSIEQGELPEDYEPGKEKPTFG